MLFAVAKCPQCSSGLPLKVLWEFSRSSAYGLVTRSGILRGNIGILCPNCGVKLRIVQTRIKVFVFVIWVATALGVALTGAYVRHAHVNVNQQYQVWSVVALLCAIGLFQRYAVVRLAQVRLAEPGEQLGFPLSGAYKKPLATDGS
jgi:hypothetical protein